MVQPLEKMLSPILINRQNTLREKGISSNDDIILLEKIKRQKYDVLNGIIEPSQADLVRPEIAESWLRCYKRGLDLFKTNYPPALEKDSFQAVLQEKELLMRSAETAIRQLKNMLYNTNCIIIMTDEQGVILSLMDATQDKRNEENHMSLGEIWNEETVGTCSHALCIYLGTPIQLCGPEHYSEAFKITIASSAPIFDQNYNLTGTLSIASMNYYDQSSHTLPLAVSMAWSIQNELRTLDSDDLLYSTLEAYNNAFMTINNKHIITKANRIAYSWFGSGDLELIGRKIEDILGEKLNISDVIKNALPVRNAQMLIDKERNLYLDEVRPIKNSINKLIGCVISIKKAISSNKTAKQKNDSPLYSFDMIVGSAPQMVETVNTTRKFAKIDASILLQGESGTGKELFAQAIHNEKRSNGPFIAVNCAAIPSNLIESELFGYEGGAFTGAERHGRPGKFELAKGGTLFLDEIGDMPLELQPVLLRVLEEKKIMRVGGSKYIPIDFTLVAATNKDLLQMVRNKRFREDLYYRLAVFKATIPPLRDRGPDIIRLAKFFLKRLADAQGVPVPMLSETVSNILLKYEWPGNVRQLENAMFYAFNMCNDGVIRLGDLPSEIREKEIDGSTDTGSSDLKDNSDSELSIKEMEKIAIIQALNKTRNNIGETARILGYSKSTLYRRIKNYNIQFNDND